MEKSLQAFILYSLGCSLLCFSTVLLANQKGTPTHNTQQQDSRADIAKPFSVDSKQFVFTGKDLDGKEFNSRDFSDRLLFLAIGTKKASEQLMFWQADVLYNINKRLYFKLYEAGLRPLSIAVADVTSLPKVTKLVVNIFLRRAEKRAIDYVMTLLSADGVVPPESFDEHFLMAADWDGSIVDQLEGRYIKGKPNIFIISPQGSLVGHYAVRQDGTDEKIFNRVSNWLTQYKQQILHNKTAKSQ